MTINVELLKLSLMKSFENKRTLKHYALKLSKDLVTWTTVQNVEECILMFYDFSV